jgi:hypothetical protein
MRTGGNRRAMGLKNDADDAKPVAARMVSGRGRFSRAAKISRTKVRGERGHGRLVHKKTEEGAARQSLREELERRIEWPRSWGVGNGRRCQGANCAPTAPRDDPDAPATCRVAENGCAYVGF